MKVGPQRATIAKRGLDELGLSMAEITRHVGVTTSGIAKAVERLEGQRRYGAGSLSLLGPQRPQSSRLIECDM